MARAERKQTRHVELSKTIMLNNYSFFHMASLILPICSFRTGLLPTLTVGLGQMQRPKKSLESKVLT